MPPTQIVESQVKVKEEGFTPPFIAWVEIDGNVIDASAMKGGADTHVSFTNMFSHKQDASDKPMNISFK